MSRHELERHLRQCGCVLHHHGRDHDVWLNPSNLAQSPVPRHSQIKRGTVRGICRILAMDHAERMPLAGWHFDSGRLELNTLSRDDLVNPEIVFQRIHAGDVIVVGIAVAPHGTARRGPACPPPP